FDGFGGSFRTAGRQYSLSFRLPYQFLWLDNWIRKCGLPRNGAPSGDPRLLEHPQASSRAWDWAWNWERSVPGWQCDCLRALRSWRVLLRARRSGGWGILSAAATAGSASCDQP